MINILICTNCNTTLPSKSDRCHKCGQELCPECGSSLDGEATACNSCGIKFDLFCPGCDIKVGSNATVCHNCGLFFEDDRFEQNKDPEFDHSQADFDSLCHNCRAPVYWSDGFCYECGQAYCPFCGQDTDEETLRCLNCLKDLYFNCPLCNFQLTANAEYCPNCNALFPKNCNQCLSTLIPGATVCSICKANIEIRQRESARTVKTIEMGTVTIRIAACPACGRTFDPQYGECPHCHLRLCSQCQIVLEDDESSCPRCGDLVEEEI